MDKGLTRKKPPVSPVYFDSSHQDLQRQKISRTETLIKNRFRGRIEPALQSVKKLLHHFFIVSKMFFDFSNANYFLFFSPKLHEH